MMSLRFPAYPDCSGMMMVRPCAPVVCRYVRCAVVVLLLLLLLLLSFFLFLLLLFFLILLLLLFSRIVLLCSGLCCCAQDRVVVLRIVLLCSGSCCCALTTRGGTSPRSPTSTAQRYRREHPLVVVV